MSAPGVDSYSTHLIITIILFALNILLTQLVMGRGFFHRLRYIGHEMVFLAIGIVGSHVFTRNHTVVLTTVFVFLLIWVVTLLLTKQVLDKEDRLYPQVGFTLILGFGSIWAALVGLIEDGLVRPFLAP